MDLFKDEVEEEKMHHNFLVLKKPENIHAQNIITEWAEGFVDRDGKIVKEFQTTFNSVFWELYLHQFLKENKQTIDFNHEYPDFVITAPHEYSIEAVIASNAQDGVPEWDQSQMKKEPDFDEIVRISTIRLANALISKYHKYKSQYSKKKELHGKPFLLAVAPFDQPFFGEQKQKAIFQVLYAFSNYIYEDDNKNNTRIITGSERLYSIEKDNGSEIPLGFFSENQMPEISGVIFSNVATFGKVRALSKDLDERKMFFSYMKYNKEGLQANQGVVQKEEYNESLDDGLSIYLNPFANIPVSQEIVDLFPSYNNFDVSMGSVIGESRDGNLLDRTVMIFNEDDEVKSLDNQLQK